MLCREDRLFKEPAGYAAALQRRGIRVVFLDRTLPLDADVHKFVEHCDKKPWLILHPDSNPAVMPGGLNRVAIPTALFQNDPYVYTHRRIRWAMLFDYVLLLHQGFEERFRAAGHPAPVTLPHAVDLTFFNDVDAERRYDVSAVGCSEGPNYRTRREVLSQLEKEFRMNDWRRVHSYRELADVYCRSFIVANVARDDFPTDVSLRFAEAMAAGALFVTFTPSELPAMGFTEGVHYIGVSRSSDFAPTIRRYLNDKVGRESIVKAAREKIVQEHSYDARVEKLIECLSRNGGKLQAPARKWPEGRVRGIYLDFFAANGNLRDAARELLQISRWSPKETLIGAALLGRAWSKRLSARLRHLK